MFLEIYDYPYFSYTNYVSLPHCLDISLKEKGLTKQSKTKQKQKQNNKLCDVYKTRTLEIHITNMCMSSYLHLHMLCYDTKSLV